MNRSVSLIVAASLGFVACLPAETAAEKNPSTRFRKPMRPDDPREAFDLWALATPDGRLRISPMRQWSRTGLELHKGQRLEITAEGKVKGCQQPVGSWAYGPFGPDGGPSDIDPDARVCALIARIVGEGEPCEFIAGAKFQLEVPHDGRLDLGVSDVWHFDNSGEFLVKVSVDGKAVDFVKLQGPSPAASPEQLTPVTTYPPMTPQSRATSAPSAGDRKTTASPDHFVGWYKENRSGPGPDRVIPIYKAGDTYYTATVLGREVPLKPCPEGLEWAITPSSMEGTKFGFDEAAGSYSLLVVDKQAQHFTDSADPPKWRPLVRIDKPSWLIDTEVSAPRSSDDFLGWYQWAWFPHVRFEVRKDGGKYVAAFQSYQGKSWKDESKLEEMTPLPDGLGFIVSLEGSKLRLSYNKNLQRIELTPEDNKSLSAVPRIPLARIHAPPSSDGGTPPPDVRIGIPSWH